MANIENKMINKKVYFNGKANLKNLSEDILFAHIFLSVLTEQEHLMAQKEPSSSFQ